MDRQEHNANWQEALDRIAKAKNNKLESLDLSQLRLTQLPPELFQLDNLKKLKLWGNELTELPPEFTQLKQLTMLDLRHNQLSSLPHNFFNLKQLAYLYLSSNQLGSLPNNVSNLKQLTEFDLRACLKSIYFRIKQQKHRNIVKNITL